MDILRKNNLDDKLTKLVKKHRSFYNETIYIKIYFITKYFLYRTFSFVVSSNLDHSISNRFQTMLSDRGNHSL